MASNSPNSPNTALFFGAQNPQAQQSAMAMLRAQLLSQQLQQSAENYQQGAQPPNPNQETQAGIGIPISRASGLARMLSQAMAGQQTTAANQQQLQASQDQMQMMADALQSQGAQSGGASGGSPSGAQMAGKVMMDQSLDPSGHLADVDTSGAIKGNQEANTIGKYTAGGVTDVPMTGAQALALSQGGNQPPAPFNMGGSPPPPPMPPQGVPNGAPVPPVPSVNQGAALPPPAGYSQAGGAIPANMLSPAPVPENVPAIGPNAAAPALAASSGSPSSAPPQIPFSQAVANAQQGMTPPAIGNSPVYAGQVAAQAEQQKTSAVNDAADMKILQTMQSNMPQAFKRFQNMRDAADNASYGMGVNEEGDGLKQQLHNQLGDNTATSNAVIKSNAAQAVLPELGPLLQNSGMKGNKFIETIANNAVGMDLSAPPAAKKAVIDSQQQSYIAGLKAVADRLRGRGLSAPSDTDIDQMVQQNTAKSPAPAAQQTNQQSQGIPAGGQVIGTSGGKRVVKMPNGQMLLEQ